MYQIWKILYVTYKNHMIFKSLIRGPPINDRNVICRSWDIKHNKIWSKI